MLLGRVTHSLDAKNRIIIPSRFAEELHGKLTLFPSITEYCIQLYDEPEWLKFYAKITVRKPTNATGWPRSPRASSRR